MTGGAVTVTAGSPGPREGVGDDGVEAVLAALADTGAHGHVQTPRHLLGVPLDGGHGDPHRAGPIGAQLASR
ncbi:hypothetical protein [Streptomyces sp. NPDC005423]|uniref:hypothetical protein n=1 Tax=Streptomyces sp. NPDC005423 TaxID=3155343 RepID=UPI0033A33D67